MESKLRNEKVVDLKKILTGAKITIPAKANKAELIQTILKSKDALAYYETMKGEGSGDASAVGTPAPVAVMSNESGAGDTTTAPKDDLLAPLEEFDWTTGQTTAPSEPTSAKPAPAPSKAKPSSKAKVTPSAAEASKPAATAASDDATKTDAAASESAPLDPEEEAKKRRAERFGMTYVPPKPKPAAKPKATANAASTKLLAANGKAASTNEDQATKTKRAERFGLPTKGKQTSVAASTGQKRSAPVDPEEEERRRKRAERFGLPVAAKSAAPAAPVNSEEEETKRKRAERFGLSAAK
ncbi:hypothetical protein SCHPADRAFT_901834 [Schizopora paradoxa]|uniref:THO1-MOS11 C-terminal domain-containing protein n=1 Tax=Schizopora paradoxa TaxID=27342 RepID=A0A0H2S2M7_9AGAM|nr:hypothetical protein SCHPADRAFT_901834 [Schizopora paradoxa]